MPPKKYLQVSILLILCSSIVNAQTRGINRDKYQIHISRISEEITIDGILNEPAWENAEKTGPFQRVLPTDTGYAIAQTQVRALYNESTIYFGIICYDPTPGRRPVESLRRDFAFGKNDNFIIFIDTYNDYTNGFAFGVSPANAKWDAIQYSGGLADLNWDIKWRSAVKNYGDRYVCEFAIPFRSVRYKEGSTEWGINFSRNDLKTSEKSSWAPMPRQFQTANLSYTGSLVWGQAVARFGATVFSHTICFSKDNTKQAGRREFQA